MKVGMQPQESGSNRPSGARPLATILALTAGLLRLIPHPWNFTPVGALGLFSGGRLRTWYSFALPLFLLVASDAALALLQGREYLFYPTTPFVYGSFLLNVLIGRALCRTNSPLRIGGASLLASMQFFLVTNFAQWLVMGVDPATATVLQPGQYPHTLAGLVQCYIAGMPFFAGTLLGDLVYSGGLFGLHALLARAYFPAESVRAVAN